MRLFSMARTFRCLQSLALLLLLAITMCTGEERQHKGGRSASHPHSARPIGPKRKIKGIGNFGEVTPSLFRGGQPTHRVVEALAKFVVDIFFDPHVYRTNSECKEVRLLGMRYGAI